jgi:serine/threonine protein kinase
MGEVYRARDLTLHRDIALKVLPDSSPGSHPGDDRSARFQREAQLLAAMNHPHIAQIYGFESSASRPRDGARGRSDPGRANRGGPDFPSRKRGGFALEIADALDAAH